MRIGVLTSGGDAPGMNAAIRAIVRTAIFNKIEVYGINRGFAGLLEEDITPMSVYSVADILQRGGTILRTSRSEFFATDAGVKKGAEVLAEYGIDHLIVIGGDGSTKGAAALKKLGVSVIVIPGTIDNDMGCSDNSIGFDTAVTTALDAISKIRDTTSAHNRINIVQVMGRKCGDIALYAGLSGGAEALILPEVKTDIDAICERLLQGKDRGKLHSIVMLAEGCGNYMDYCVKIEERTQVTTRGTNLGYIQRGGSPSNADRNLACFMGYNAVMNIIRKTTGCVIVQRCGSYLGIPLEEALQMKKIFRQDIYEMASVLSI
ncbi:ATP-dependent 6-phosphofructokinase [Acetobacterium fimetarium]|uniref:6-phosphofructokinase n=1 Tax=Acetobacterium fimetarium TaxID=52691 RepID=A0ABR6WUB5_9FIRM|nr:ATP-dependent 6-phosphofructokinase [Acetobacterium fimetarium]MBC3803806.1 ATP-dependent 6-phosphofructokinase [Acetobacterium fimetarium]